MKILEALNVPQQLHYKNVTGDVRQHSDGSFWGKITSHPNMSVIYQGKTFEELKADFMFFAKDILNDEQTSKKNTKIPPKQPVYV